MARLVLNHSTNINGLIKWLRKLAKEELIKNADLVTEMNLIRHPFKEKGVKAQKGIEF